MWSIFWKFWIWFLINHVIMLHSFWLSPVLPKHNINVHITAIYISMAVRIIRKVIDFGGNDHMVQKGLSSRRSCNGDNVRIVNFPVILFITNDYCYLSNFDSLSDTICWGPWMAACSQYSLACWSIDFKKFTILLKVKWSTEYVITTGIIAKMISIFIGNHFCLHVT